MLKEFTQIHIQKALEKAANEAKVNVESHKREGRNIEQYEPIYSDEYHTQHKNLDGSTLCVQVTVNKPSILNCYKNEIK